MSGSEMDKKLSRRTLLKGMGLVGSMAALSACVAPAAPAAPAGEAVGSAPATAKTEITMWHGWTGADNTEMLTRHD